MTGPGQLKPFPSDVDVAIVAHNNLDVLPGTLASLADAACPADRITVVDVASTDGTGDWLRARVAAVRVRRLDRNDGPSPGRNVGIREAPQPLRAADGRRRPVQPDTIQRLRAAMIDDRRRSRSAARSWCTQDRPDMIQYAGGAPPLHLRSDQPVAGSAAGRTRAARRSTSAPRRPAACCSIGRRPSTSGCSTSAISSARKTATSRTGCWLAGYRILELPERARAAPQPAARHLAVLLSDPQPLALHAEELPVADAHRRFCPRWPSTSRCSSSCFTSRATACVYWKAVGGLLAMLPACRATAR